MDGPDWDAEHLAVPAFALFMAVSTTLTNAPAALAEILVPRARTIFDLRYTRTVRTAISVQTAGSAALEIRLQFSTDGGTNWAYLDGSTGGTAGDGPGANAGVTGPRVSEWKTLVAAAKVDDCLLRAVTINGDGVADPVIFRVELHTR